MTGHFSHPDYDSLIFRKYTNYYHTDKIPLL